MHAEALTVGPLEDYIDRSGVPSPRRGGVPREAPHCLRGESSGQELWPCRMCRLRRLRRRSATRQRRRNREVSGCLTSESEERETWTAESLRTASSIEEASAFFGNGAVMEETSAVDVSGQHYWISQRASFAGDKSGTSSNVVISRDQFSPT